MFLNAINHKTWGVYFDAFRSKAYDGGGEENLTFNGTHCNVGSGLDPDSGIFTVPVGGQYFFMFHIATHDHKNSMAGQSIVIDCIRGDEIVIYAYTGTWLAD